MANFLLALEKVLKHEGGYVNNPHDPGKETYKGISRVHHPDWKGWVLIDELKENSQFPKCLDDFNRITNLVNEFYKIHYWNKFQGNLVPSQRIAEELFDTGVNMGVKRAVLFLQQSLNILNREGRLFKDLKTDGSIGRKTFDALQIVLSSDSEELIFKVLNLFQGKYYLELTANREKMEIFIRGWLTRVSIEKL